MTQQLSSTSDIISRTLIGNYTISGNQDNVIYMIVMLIFTAKIS